jgi:D-glycero-alpha-D-manno-heptose-7-phosphate kinase
LDRTSHRVRARAWCRVDLAGGTLDIWPLGLLHPGARTVNLAVDLPVEVELTLPEDPPGDTKAAFVVSQGEDRREAASAAGLIEHPATSLVGRVAEALDLPPFEARLSSASPRGGGLGASSAMVVGLIAAAEELFDRPRSSPDRLAVLGRDLESRMMALPTGVQDHHAALLGGLLDIRYTLGGDTVHRLPLDEEALGASLVLAFTGQSHFSAGQNWQIIRRRRLRGRISSLGHVSHWPTFTKARSAGEYCQQAARVSSTKPQTTVVSQRGVKCPRMVSDSLMLTSRASARARV